MPKSKFNQVIHVVVPSSFAAEVGSFLIDRQARGLSKNTIVFYQKELGWFSSWLGDVEVEDISPDDLRRYLVHISETRNPGGCACAYRSLSAFFRWYEDEVEPVNWLNPISKVKSPKVPDAQLQPVSVADLQLMLAGCDKHTFAGCRDRALLLALLDTGCRASEFAAINISDVEMSTGAIMIREGKGAKFRTVFLGATTRRELTRYLRYRRGAKPSDALWIALSGHRVTYFGLREIVRRCALRAGVDAPSLHSFRRGFALACLRAGMDLISLQRLMGHADLTVLRRYLSQTVDDLAAAHARCGPVDVVR